MDLECPRCSHPLKLGRPKPGAYGLKCPECAAALKLRVPADPTVLPDLSAQDQAPEAVRSEEGAGDSEFDRTIEDVLAEREDRDHSGAVGATWSASREA